MVTCAIIACNSCSRDPPRAKIIAQLLYSELQLSHRTKFWPTLLVRMQFKTKPPQSRMMGDGEVESSNRSKSFVFRGWQIGSCPPLRFDGGEVKVEKQRWREVFLWDEHHCHQVDLLKKIICYTPTTFAKIIERDYIRLLNANLFARWRQRLWIKLFVYAHLRPKYLSCQHLRLPLPEALGWNSTRPLAE